MSGPLNHNQGLLARQPVEYSHSTVQIQTPPPRSSGATSTGLSVDRYALPAIARAVDGRLLNRGWYMKGDRLCVTGFVLFDSFASHYVDPRTWGKLVSAVNRCYMSYFVGPRIKRF